VLIPQHPRPVERRRAVAEMTVAYKQVATIAPGHVFEMPPAATEAAAGDASHVPPLPEPELSRNGDDTPI
jgi:hypothetical protein